MITITKGKGTSLKGVKFLSQNGEIIIGDNVSFGIGVTINVSERLEIGDRSVIGPYFEISGRRIKIGREFWSGKHCTIGGGSCFEKNSNLEIGDFVHLGDGGFINTARPVKIGNEVGLGQDIRIYTHGAYLNFLRGFPVEFGPVTIEDNCWLPKATVMPNVTIGHDTVVGAGAIVTKSLPSGCLALGTPAKVLRENCYPKTYTDEELEKMISDFIRDFKENILDISITQMGSKVHIAGTIFDLKNLIIFGVANESTEKFKNELRRWGCRFCYFPDTETGMYRSWGDKS